MRKKIALFFVLLSGCSTPQTITKPVVVTVPEPVPCRVEMVQPSAWPTDKKRSMTGLYERVQAVLAENELRKAYEADLLAALRACQ